MTPAVAVVRWQPDLRRPGRRRLSGGWMMARTGG